MVRREVPQLVGLSSHQQLWTVRNPDALVIKVGLLSARTKGGFFGSRAGKKGTVQNCNLRVTRWIWYGDRKKARIFIVNTFKLNALIRPEVSET